MTTEAEARVMKLQAPPEAERPGGIDPESQRESRRSAVQKDYVKK